ncbi:MAG: hypothetical protein ABIA74_03255 [bacterium]
MFKKLFFITTLFLFTSICAQEENQTPSVVETTQPENNLIKKDSKDLDYLLELYANDKWGFMGKKFIDEPYNKRAALRNLKNLNELFIFLLDPIILFVLFAILAINTDNKYDSKTQNKILLSASIIEIILIIIIHAITTKKLKKQIILKSEKYNYETINDFLKNWVTYKKITPAKLHPLIEKLTKIFNSLNKEDLDKIINEIKQQVIENHLIYYDKNRKPLIIIT